MVWESVEAAIPLALARRKPQHEKSTTIGRFTQSRKFAHSEERSVEWDCDQRTFRRKVTSTEPSEDVACCFSAQDTNSGNESNVTQSTGNRFLTEFIAGLGKAFLQGEDWDMEARQVPRIVRSCARYQR